MNSLYAVFRKYCREHGEELILGAFDQFVFIYFIILLINCEKQTVWCLPVYFSGCFKILFLRKKPHVCIVSNNKTAGPCIINENIFPFFKSFLPFNLIRFVAFELCILDFRMFFFPDICGVVR